MQVSVRATIASLTLCLMLLAASTAVADGSGTATSPAIGWVFDMHPDVNGEPTGPVYLRVGARRVLVLKRGACPFMPLDRSDYQEHGVPHSAVTACSGSWADEGEDLYVLRRRGVLDVYAHATGEGPPDPYRLIRAIPLR